jgi:Tfp pilus assembly protein PilX
MKKPTRTDMRMQDISAKQAGAALVVSLILLVVVTVLAISGMNTATTELAMARNAQNYEYAFQAAETGLENALAQGQFNTTANVNVSRNINHFNVTATAESRRDPDATTDRDSSAIHTQAFYVVGPEPSTL